MGILVAAVVTTVAVTVFYGFFALRVASPGDRWVLLIAGLAALPLEPLVFYLIRLPLDRLALPVTGQGMVHVAIASLYAPLTEEPAKWLVLLLPPVAAALRRGSVAGVALATGVGFGIGEIWFLAISLSAVPAYAALPFWMFGGFFGERLLVCFLHGAFVWFLFARVGQSRNPVPGALAGMALHYALNLPLFLGSVGALGLSFATWQQIASLVMIAMVVALVAAMNRLSHGRLRHDMLGRSHCPHCGTDFPRPLFAANLCFARLERCPACKHFNFVPQWR